MEEYVLFANNSDNGNILFYPYKCQHTSAWLIIFSRRMSSRIQVILFCCCLYYFFCIFSEETLKVKNADLSSYIRKQNLRVRSKSEWQSKILSSHVITD